MDHIKELDEHLDSYSELVRRNVKITTPEEVPGGKMLHISTNGGIKEFIPMLPSRAITGEDKTVPRACVAPTLLGCFIGYTKALYTDFYLPSNAKNDERYKGGWVIYNLPVKAALRPTEKLVPDAERTDEHWVVAYNKESSSVKPEKLGKAFIHCAIFTAQSGETPKAEIELYICVDSEDGLQFSKNVHLSKGYYSVFGPDFQEVNHWGDDSPYGVRAIDKEEYARVKEQSANLLGEPLSLPTYLKW